MKNYVLITGASSGIGKEIAIKFIDDGYPVILVSRQLAKLEKFVQSIQGQASNEILFFPTDLSSANEIDQLLVNLKRANVSIQGLINCAGFGDFQSFEKQSFAIIDNMFKVNTLGMMYLTQKILSEYKDDLEHIFFVASIAGKIATPNAAGYSASKAAIIAFANSLRMELVTKGIGVTTINPGPVKTGFFSRSIQMQDYYHRIQKFAINPQLIAKKIAKVYKYKKNKRELNIPTWWTAISMVYFLCGRLFEFLVLKLFNFKEGVSK